MSIKLYELSNTINEVWNLLESEDVDLEVIESTLLSLEAAFEEKADGIASIMKSLDAEAEAIKAEEVRLAARRKAAENRKEWLKWYLEREMERSGLSKVKTPKFTVSLQLNPPSVEVLDPGVIPSNFWKVPEPQLDKKSIVQAFKEGQLIDGVRLVQKRGIRVK